MGDIYRVYSVKNHCFSMKNTWFYAISRKVFWAEYAKMCLFFMKNACIYRVKCMKIDLLRGVPYTYVVCIGGR